MGDVAQEHFAQRPIENALYFIVVPPRDLANDQTPVAVFREPALVPGR